MIRQPVRHPLTRTTTRGPVPGAGLIHRSTSPRGGLSASSAQRQSVSNPLLQPTFASRAPAGTSPLETRSSDLALDGTRPTSGSSTTPSRSAPGGRVPVLVRLLAAPSTRPSGTSTRQQGRGRASAQCPCRVGSIQPGYVNTEWPFRARGAFDRGRPASLVRRKSRRTRGAAPSLAGGGARRTCSSRFENLD
jgi:hypothetical protein